MRNNYKAIRGSLYANADDTDEEIIWDYVILDEGHIIKNPKTQRAKSLVEIPSDHRIVISGTPIQNNLKVTLYVIRLRDFLGLSCNLKLTMLLFSLATRNYGRCSTFAAQKSWVIRMSNEQIFDIDFPIFQELNEY